MFNNLKPAIPPLLLVVLERAVNAVWKTWPEWLSGAVLGLGLLWLALSLLYLVRTRPFVKAWFPFLDPVGHASDAELRQKLVHGKTFHIWRIVQNGMVVGQTFESCVIHGPSVVAAVGATVMRRPHFGMLNPLEHTFIETKTDPSTGLGHSLEGVVQLKDCTFNDCQFYNIGVCGPSREAWYKMIGADVSPNPQNRTY